MRGIEKKNFHENSENIQEIKNELGKLKSEIYAVEVHKGIGRLGGSIQLLRREGRQSLPNKALTSLLKEQLFYLKKGKLGLEISYTGGGRGTESRDKKQFFEILFFVSPELEDGMADVRQKPNLIRLWIDVDDMDLSSPHLVAEQLLDRIVANNEQGLFLRNLMKPYIEEFIDDLWISRSDIKLKKEPSGELVLLYKRGNIEYPLFIRKHEDNSVSLTSIILTDNPISINIDKIKDINDFNIKLGAALDLLLGKLRDKIPDIGTEIYNYFFNQ